MKKFRILVMTPVEVEIDETKIDEKWMEEFRETFYGFTELSEHAEHLAQLFVRVPDMKFVEGYGIVKQDGKWPYLQTNSGPMRADEVQKKYKNNVNHLEGGINVNVLDDEVDTELED